MIAKMGEIMAHHWAHETLIDCDPWSEPMSQWHLDWQMAVPEACREVVIGRHRADIVSSKGRVTEIQKSSITAAEIEARDDYYFAATGRWPTWIFHAEDTDLRIGKAWEFKGESWRAGRWCHPMKRVLAPQGVVYLDRGNYLIRLSSLTQLTKGAGWNPRPGPWVWRGTWHSRDQVMAQLSRATANGPLIATAVAA